MMVTVLHNTIVCASNNVLILWHSCKQWWSLYCSQCWPLLGLLCLSLAYSIFNSKMSLKMPKGGGGVIRIRISKNCYYYVDCGIRRTVKVKLLLEWFHSYIVKTFADINVFVFNIINTLRYCSLQMILWKRCVQMLIWFIVFNSTFINISTISWRPVLVVEEAGVPGENHRPWASNW